MTKDTKPATSQKQRFIEAARAAECSEDEAVFDEAMKKIAKVRQMDEKPKK